MYRKTFQLLAVLEKLQARIARVAFVFALVAAALPPLVAKPPAWTRVTSPNFELYTTAGEKRGREVVSYFEQVRDLFTRIRGSKGHAKQRVRLVVFSNDREYEPYRANSFAAAYYLGNSEGLNMIVMRAARSEYFPIAVHEYTHLWIRNLGLELPVWLNEGLAEVHSTLESTGKRIALGHPIVGRLRELRTGKWLPVSRLINVAHDSPEYNEKDRAGVFYAQSWLLTHMLYLGQPFREEWNKFLKALGETGSAEQAFRIAYGLTPEQMDNALRRYSESASMSYMFFDARVEKPDDLPVAAPAPDNEATLVLAQLLGLLHKTEEAERMYEELAQREPDSWKVAEARAMTAWQNRDLEGAKKHFSRAVELKSTNAAMYLDYAKLIYGENLERAATAARRAVELDGTNTEARLLYGDMLYRQEQWKPALEQLLKVKQVTPDRAVHLFTMIAHAAYRTGDRKMALDHAQQAVKYARKEDEKRLAQDILRYVSPAPAVAAAPGVEDDDEEQEAPVQASELPRREAPRLRAQENSLSVEGTFTHLDCSGTTARLHVTVGGQKRWFVIKDPGQVIIQTPEGKPTLDFQCGPQKSRRVLVEHDAANVVLRLQFFD